uniref:NADP-dependent oxidoreductase domain-containing protein n=1 Tax=Craspedostauros australis TaxID=1486917 RepID=A0A7R9WPP7_9STRA
MEAFVNTVRDEAASSGAPDGAMMDTAIMYQKGNTQKVMGKICQRSTVLGSPRIAAKANPIAPGNDLSPPNLRQQLEDSLRDLQVEQVDLFYLHAPDANNPIEPTLETVQALYEEGRFLRFGLSNFTAWETVHIHAYMKQRSYILPTVYQGMYNAITRMVETELFPALRRCDMVFYAYNPLAGGMLTGKYTPQCDNKDVGQRFAGSSWWAKIYRDRFQQADQYAAIELVRQAVGNDIAMADASLRWMRYHSKLIADDGIIVGSSSLHHLQTNLAALQQGPLPASVVEAFDTANERCAHICPMYSRGYSGSKLE